ncbi:MAG: hypothetical protein JSW04_09455, partial [Desulfobacterales bacterium]
KSDMPLITLERQCTLNLLDFKYHHVVHHSERIQLSLLIDQFQKSIEIRNLFICRRKHANGL